MTPMELVQACKHTIEAGLDNVALVIPGPPTRGERIRLDRASRRKCPLGEVANWTENGTVAIFNAIEVLAWLTARGMINYRVVDPEVTP